LVLVFDGGEAGRGIQVAEADVAEAKATFMAKHPEAFWAEFADFSVWRMDTLLKARCGWRMNERQMKTVLVVGSVKRSEQRTLNVGFCLAGTWAGSGARAP
jgi:hypothetical protein